jgi:hypothetical protein
MIISQFQAQLLNVLPSFQNALHTEVLLYLADLQVAEYQNVDSQTSKLSARQIVDAIKWRPSKMSNFQVVGPSDCR